MHRWVGLALALPFVVWTVTGLLFHLKPGWARAYEMLSIEDDAASLPLDAIPPPVATRETARKAELFATAIGPLYRVTSVAAGARVVELVDARSGELVSPIGEDAARALASDAVRRSPYRTEYGAVAGVEGNDRTFAVRFVGGQIVRVDRRSGALAREGSDTATIDALYRLHYLKWTGVSVIDRALSIVAIVATWLLTTLGLVLFVRKYPRRRSSVAAAVPSPPAT